MPGWLAIAVSPFSNIYYWMIGAKPLFTKYSVRVLSSNAEISNAKAKRYLGFSSRPFEESLADSVKWFGQNRKLLK